MSCPVCGKGPTDMQRLRRRIDSEYWDTRFLRGLPTNKKDLYMPYRRLEAAIRVIEGTDGPALRERNRICSARW